MASLYTFVGFGALATTSFKYRARLDGAGTLKLRYSTDKTFATYQETTGVSVVVANDYTGGEQVTGLQPDTVYYCQPVADGVPSELKTQDGDAPRVRTAPTQAKDFKVAFGSCNDAADPNPDYVWQGIQSTDPEFFIHLGDFQYIDSQDTGTMRTEYQTMHDTGHDYMRSMAWMGGVERIWSDHDYGVPDGDGSSATKSTALQVWKEYTAHHDLASPDDGIWRNWTYGQVEFFMLDCRYQKMPLAESDRWPTLGADSILLESESTPTSIVMAPGINPTTGVDDYYAGWYLVIEDDWIIRTTYEDVHTSSGQWRRVTASAVTGGDLVLTPDTPFTDLSGSRYGMLVNASVLDGINPMQPDNQVEWLVAALKASTATWKIICSDFIMNNTHTAGDNWRKYSGHQMNGEVRYLAHAVTGEVDNVFVISGDAHRSFSDDGTNSPFPEASSGPLNHSPFTEGSPSDWSHGKSIHPPSDADPDSIGFMFGVLDFKTDPRSLTITHYYSGIANPTRVLEITPLESVLAGRPFMPSAFEDINVSLRGPDDGSFRFRVPGTGPIDMGEAGSIPVSYRLVITPDLGWQDTDAMFTAYSVSARTGNSRLSTFTVDVGDLEQDGDEYILTLSDIEWSQVIRPRFKRYLWKVAGISSVGTVGSYSDIQTFQLVSEIPESSWTIKDPSPPNGWVQVLQGTKDSTIQSIEVLGHSPTVITTETTWTVELPLNKAETVLYVRAVNVAGETSTYESVRVELSTSVVEAFSLWNSFDEHGLILSTPRLPGETNFDYRSRLNDVFVHRGSARYRGLRNALTRDLGLLDEQVDSAVIISRSLDLHYTESVDDAVRMLIHNDAFVLLGQIFRRYNETHVVNPHDWTITLNDPLEDTAFQVHLGDKLLSFFDFTIVDAQTLRFRTNEYNNQEVRVDYSYRVDTSLDGLTLAQLKTTLEAIRVQGKQLLTVTVGDGCDAYAAQGLEWMGPFPITNQPRADYGGVEVTGIPVRWSPVRLYALQDPDFLLLHTNEFGNLFHTKVDGWSQRLQSRFSMQWGRAVADRSRWFSRALLRGHAGLPTTLDLPKTYWVSSSTGLRYTTRQYAALGGLCPVDGSKLIREGLHLAYFKSGVGAGEDLKVRVSQDETIAESTPDTLISVVRDIPEVPDAG